jgi:hypothetical protein
VGADDAARLSCFAAKYVEEIEETIMYFDRRYTGSLVLALVSLIVGLALLTQESGLAVRGMFIQLPALLLIVYGLVVARWYTRRAVSVLEVQTARAVHRALRGSFDRWR